MIDIEGLTKVYTRGRHENPWALDGVTFTVPDASIFGFLGPNGAGKTRGRRLHPTNPWSCATTVQAEE